MLRIHLLQELYDLADMEAMNEVIDSRAFSEFCGIDSSNQVPDGDTIGRFRALLVKHGLQKKLFSQVVELLEAKVMILKKGTIVNSSIIAAVASTCCTSPLILSTPICALQPKCQRLPFLVWWASGSRFFSRSFVELGAGVIPLPIRECALY